MTSLHDLVGKAPKLRFGKPLAHGVSKLDLQDSGGKDGHSSVARNSGSTECTTCTTTGLCCFGISETTFAIDSVGDGKSTIVGFVPKNFFAFDQIMSKENGGFGIDAKGGLVGFEPVGKAPNLSFTTGDKVTFKLDFLEGLSGITIEGTGGKKKADAVVVNFDPRAMHGVCFPACSLGSSGASVSIDKTVDLTGTDAFVKKLGGGAQMKGGKSGANGDQYLPDAFGSFWMRLWCRMKDNDTIKVPGSSQPFHKADVMSQMLLHGVDSWSHANATAVASVGECPAMERARMIFFQATNAMFADGSRTASNMKDALSKSHLPLVQGGGQGGQFSPFCYFAQALVNHMDSEREGTIQQLQHALLSLKSRVDDLDGGKGGGGGGGGDFLPDIKKKNSGISAPSATAAASSHSHSGGGSSHSKAPASKPSTKAFSKEPSKAPAAKKSAPASKPAGKTAHATSGGPSGSNIMQTIRALTKRAEEIHTLSQKGSPTDDDLKKLEDAKVKMSKEKLAAAKALNGATAAALNAIDEDMQSEIMDFFEDMVADGDHIDGNAQYAHALIDKIPLDWAQFVGSKHLDSVAAYDGSMEYLDVFLQIDGLETDTVDLLQNAMFNQSRRIPTVLKVLEYESILGLEEVVEEVQDTWQEFFEDICSQAKSIPREDRTGRMDLISKALKHATLTVDPMREGSDGQTAFSRAAKEGDIPLMKLLLKESKIDVNKVSTDTTTALIQAVVANEVEAVKLILSQPKVNVGHVSQEGSALFLSRALHRDAAIVKALEGAK